MRSESTSALGQPRLTKPIFWVGWGMADGYRGRARKRLIIRDGHALAAAVTIAASATDRGRAMGQDITIPTGGTHCIGAYMATAEGKPKGGLVVIQEIYGVTAHIRRVVDHFAALGYTAIAPAFFDHLESGVELAYDQVGTNKGRNLVNELGLEAAVGELLRRAQPAVPARGAQGAGDVPFRREGSEHHAGDGGETSRGAAADGIVHLPGGPRVQPRWQQGVSRSQRQTGAAAHAGLLRQAPGQRMSEAFTLDPRLAADTRLLASLPLCDVRLMDDARYGWLVLVPRR